MLLHHSLVEAYHSAATAGDILLDQGLTSGHSEQAEKYSSKAWQIEMQQRIADELRAKLDFIGVSWAGEQSVSEKQVRLLDYACGTGNISRALAPFVTSITGIDLSENMAAKFNESFAGSSLKTPPRLANGGTGHAMVGDLLSDPPSSTLDKPELFDYEIATVGVGFHHFPDPAQALARLAQRVKAGTGVVLIIDWLPDEAGHQAHHHHDGHCQHRAHAGGHGSEHAHGVGGDPLFGSADDHGGANHRVMSTIKTHGFTEHDMRQHFEAAGCTDFGFSLLAEPFVMWLGEGEHERRVEKRLFLARGQRKD